MSTYLKANSPSNNNFDDIFPILNEFLKYYSGIKGRAIATVNGYYIDLRTFFRFIKLHKNLVSKDIDFNSIQISDINIDNILSITVSDIYEFIFYCQNQLSNSLNARNRKLSSIRSFFKFLKNNGYIKENITVGIESAKTKKSLPKYLTLEESIELLNTVSSCSGFYERDYCIITLFLNCGMRLSELTNINLNDISELSVRVLGKGNKERVIHLNPACLDALSIYLLERNKILGIKDKNALFISTKTKQKLTNKRISQIVDNCFKSAGLGNRGFTTHKLRHTAATLMYQHGNADVLTLKEILGHSSVATTEIYTHLSSKQSIDALNNSPIANIKTSKDKK